VLQPWQRRWIFDAPNQQDVPLHSFAEPFEPLSDQARARSRAEALSQAPHLDGEIWIFGYGSLLWDAPFTPTAVLPARLSGWQRAMCVWTALARGTPDCPGLSLGLIPGGGCEGLAFQIAMADRDAALAAIWQREMWTDIYHPTWVGLDMDGTRIEALTFVINQASPQYAGELSQAEMIRHIALARGERGPCRDYLGDTIGKLRGLGIIEPELEKLYAGVMAFQGY
jgi:cation transport protein ChaC